jgi:hypothetical protein
VRQSVTDLDGIIHDKDSTSSTGPPLRKSTADPLGKEKEKKTIRQCMNLPEAALPPISPTRQCSRQITALVTIILPERALFRTPKPLINADSPSP